MSAKFRYLAKSISTRFLFPALNVTRHFESFSIAYLNSRNRVAVGFSDPERREILEKIREVAGQTELLLNPYESYSICMAVKSVLKLDGSMAEVGVYRGGSAKLICEYKGNSPLHLFDTFEGLPSPTESDTSMGFHEGQFKNTSRELVEDLLRQYPNVHVHQGFFPSTAGSVKEELFSFINLDVDLHDSTLAALEFFYPRMKKGGIILSHDYATADGVKKAIDGFFAEKLEPILLVSDSQCLVVKG